LSTKFKFSQKIAGKDDRVTEMWIFLPWLGHPQLRRQLPQPLMDLIKLNAVEAGPDCKSRLAIDFSDRVLL
jgi:hypothetical protein